MHETSQLALGAAAVGLAGTWAWRQRLALRPVHRASAIALAWFLAAHLLGHLAGLAGAAAHQSVLQALRLIYRQPLVEGVLLGCLLFQMGSGLTLLWRGRGRRRGGVAWMQAISGGLPGAVPVDPCDGRLGGPVSGRGHEPAVCSGGHAHTALAVVLWPVLLFRRVRAGHARGLRFVLEPARASAGASVGGGHAGGLDAGCLFGGAGGGRIPCAGDSGSLPGPPGRARRSGLKGARASALPAVFAVYAPAWLRSQALTPATTSGARCLRGATR